MNFSPQTLKIDELRYYPKKGDIFTMLKVAIRHKCQHLRLRV